MKYFIFPSEPGRQIQDSVDDAPRGAIAAAVNGVGHGPALCPRGTSGATRDLRSGVDAQVSQ